MSARSVSRRSTIAGYASVSIAPMYVDSDDNILKLVPAGSGTTEQYVVHYTPSPTGGDTGKGVGITITPVAGNAGLRQGGINLQVTRASTAAITATWDGNPDQGLKIISRNNADNTVGGASRALDVQARNSGTTQTWVKTIECNARNDSGKTVDSLYGMHIRCENYGNVNTDIVGLDIEMSDENDGGTHTKDAILIRNTDASAQTAVGSVIKLSNTSTNGFTSLLDLTGIAAANATLISTSGSAATTWAGRIKILDASGTAAWINIYSTSGES